MTDPKHADSDWERDHRSADGTYDAEMWGNPAEREPSAAAVPEWVTLEDVAGIIRAAAQGAEGKGGLTECSAAALNSWAEVIERNLNAVAK